MKFQDSSFNGLKVTVSTKSVTHATTHARTPPPTHAPKAICPINFFKVGGIKINFYDSGSVVIQGVKCTIFADMHFEMLKHKVEYGGEPHEEIPAQSPEKTPLSTAYISEIGSGTNATPYTPRGSTCEDSVQTNDTPVRLTPKERVNLHSKN